MTYPSVLVYNLTPIIITLIKEGYVMSKQVISVILLLSCVASSHAGGERRTSADVVAGQPKSTVTMPASTNRRPTPNQPITFQGGPHERQSRNVFRAWPEANPTLPQTGNIGKILTSYAQAEAIRANLQANYRATLYRLIDDSCYSEEESEFKRRQSVIARNDGWHVLNTAEATAGVLDTTFDGIRIHFFTPQHRTVTKNNGSPRAIAITNHAGYFQHVVRVIPALRNLSALLKEERDKRYHGTVQEQSMYYYSQKHPQAPIEKQIRPLGALATVIGTLEKVGNYPAQATTAPWNIPVTPEHSDLSIHETLFSILVNNGTAPMAAIGAVHLEMLRNEMEKTLDSSRKLTHFKIWPFPYQTQIINKIAELAALQKPKEKDIEDLFTLRNMLELQKIRDLYLASSADVTTFTAALFKEDKERYEQMVAHIKEQIKAKEAATGNTCLDTGNKNSHSLILMLNAYQRRLRQLTLDVTTARTAQQPAPVIVTENSTPAASTTSAAE